MTAAASNDDPSKHVPPSKRVSHRPASPAAVNTGIGLFNASIGITGRGVKKAYRTPAPIMLQTQKLIKELVMVLGNQVLKHGLFSSDPHPGNVMLLPDGRLGLIDFGQAKELSRQQRAVIARQVIAVATGDEQAMLEIARAS